MAPKPREDGELTVREALLQAAGQLDQLRGGHPFTPEDLTITAWRVRPQMFGLRGYEQEFPNAGMVYAKVVDLTKCGTLRRVGREGGGSCLCLTRLGKAQARPLVKQLELHMRREASSESPEDAAPSPPEQMPAPCAPAAAPIPPVPPVTTAYVRAATPSPQSTPQRTVWRRRPAVAEAPVPEQRERVAELPKPAPKLPATAADPASGRRTIRSEVPPIAQAAAAFPFAKRARVVPATEG